MDFWIPAILIGLGSLNIGVHLGNIEQRSNIIESCTLHGVYIDGKTKLTCSVEEK